MMIDDSELERIYSQQIQEELSKQNKLAVTKFIEYFPSVFGLDNLILQLNESSIHEKITALYQQVYETFIDHGLPFDHVWVKTNMFSPLSISSLYFLELDHDLETTIMF